MRAENEKKNTRKCEQSRHIHPGRRQRSSQRERSQCTGESNWLFSLLGGGNKIFAKRIILAEIKINISLPNSPVRGPGIGNVDRCGDRRRLDWILFFRSAAAWRMKYDIDRLSKHFLAHIFHDMVFAQAQSMMWSLLIVHECISLCARRVFIANSFFSP